MKQKKLMHPNLFFLLSTIIAYVVFITGLWLYANISLSLKSQFGVLNTYTNKHAKELQKSVFHDGFLEAKRCSSLPLEKDQKACKENLSKSLGSVMKEEELLGSGFGWPDDLTFIKKEGDSFHRLHWSGELQDITQNVHTKMLKSYVPYMWRFLTRNCHFFMVYDTSPYSCEIYQKIPSTDTNYLVRLVTLEEEKSFLFLLIIFPLFLMYFITAGGYLPGRGYSPLIFISLVIILVPLLAAFIATKIYKKRYFKK